MKNEEEIERRIKAMILKKIKDARQETNDIVTGVDNEKTRKWRHENRFMLERFRTKH